MQGPFLSETPVIYAPHRRNHARTCRESGAGMTIPPFGTGAEIDPLRALLHTDRPGVLAIITGTEGPSYRPLGAMMALRGAGERIGALSSGCIEADIARHAAATLRTGKPARIAYGCGSPFIDLRLPCGGGMDILLLPGPDKAVLGEVCARNARRIACTLRIGPEDGTLSVTAGGATGFDNGHFAVRLEPDPFFHVFGKGPEAGAFAGLVQAAGYPNLLLSPDEDTLAAARALGGQTRHLKSPAFPEDLSPDARSAVVLFFHDHEWEPPILQGALRSRAFYIGAQGSAQSAEARRRELAALGVGASDIARVRGPIGLIPSVREARKLAVSVLAEILNEV